jgi:hypothetical protein
MSPISLCVEIYWCDVTDAECSKWGVRNRKKMPYYPQYRASFPFQYRVLKIKRDRLIFGSLRINIKKMIVRSPVFWDITPCSPLKGDRRFGGTCPSACHLLPHWFLSLPILRPWRWRWHVAQQRRPTFNGLHIPEDRTFHSHRCENLKSYMRRSDGWF